MRRILVTLVLAAISLTLMPLSLLATEDLPACCRKDGKHKCAMMEMDSSDDDAGPSFRAASKCPMFPSRLQVGTSIKTDGAPMPQHGVKIAIASFLTSAEQIDTLARISFSRSRQKRGPPVSSQSI